MVEYERVRITEGVTALVPGEPDKMHQLLDLVREVWDLRSHVAEFDTAAASLDNRGIAGLTTGIVALGLAATALTGSIDYECDLTDPPQDIKGRPHGSDGDMEYQCFHNPAHCWNRTWKAIPCDS